MARKFSTIPLHEQLVLKTKRVTLCQKACTPEADKNVTISITIKQHIMVCFNSAIPAAEKLEIVTFEHMS